MIKFQGPFASACVFIAINALLHFVVPVFAGFGAESQQLVIAGVVWAVLCFGLLKGWRWLGYIAFIFCLMGSIVAMAGAFGPSTVPSLLFILIVIADVSAGVLLFKALWKDPVSAS